MVKIGRIADEITKQLHLYSQTVDSDLREVVHEVSKDTVQMIKQNIVKVGLVRTGAYKDGWTVSKKKLGTVIHNATNYQQTHLLEKGHVLRNGGRVSGRPHIGPAEEWMEQEFEARLIKRLKQ